MVALAKYGLCFLPRTVLSPMEIKAQEAAELRTKMLDDFIRSLGYSEENPPKDATLVTLQGDVMGDEIVKIDGKIVGRIQTRWEEIEGGGKGYVIEIRKAA